MNTIVLQVITSFLGSIGFAIVFRTRWRIMLSAAAGGVLTWVIYLLAGNVFGQGFEACMIAAFCGNIYAQLLARVVRTPATPFLVLSIFPLIPGASLYYTMSDAVNGNWDQVISSGLTTIQFALAIAAGISLAEALFIMIREGQARRKARLDKSEKKHCDE
jgi:uncharacterized membrane protein YjjB (DUF3815 family)